MRSCRNREGSMVRHRPDWF